MGFFNKLFGGKTDYPELQAGSPATQRLQGNKEALTSLAEQVRDSLEVVPAAEKTFVFIGKPPKQFGLAWIEGQEVKNLKSLVKEEGLDASQMTKLVDKLRAAYEHHEEEQRFKAELAGREFVVTPSEALGREVKEIVESATH